MRELAKGDRELTDCPHSSVSTLLKATIINELAHMYDHKMKNSKDAEFLNIAGRYKNGLIFKRRKNLNEDQGRSPDPYEFKSGAESFAVNMEHFLLDPNYKCRRPTFYEYYSKKLNFSAHALDASMDATEMTWEIPVVGQLATVTSAPFLILLTSSGVIHDKEVIVAAKADAQDFLAGEEATNNLIKVVDLLKTNVPELSEATDEQIAQMIATLE